jgi:hypothetical protein
LVKFMEDKNLDRNVNARNVTPKEIAYRDGYVEGQESSSQQRYNDRLQHENQQVRESDSAANGLLIGMVLTTIIGAGLAAFFVISQSQKVPVRSAAPKIEKETKVIEKTTDRVREIAPAAPPNVEIVIPNAPQQPSATQPNQTLPPPAANSQPATTNPPPAETKVDQSKQTETQQSQPASN